MARGLGKITVAVANFLSWSLKCPFSSSRRTFLAPLFMRASNTRSRQDNHHEQQVAYLSSHSRNYQSTSPVPLGFTVGCACDYTPSKAGRSLMYISCASLSLSLSCTALECGEAACQPAWLIVYCVLSPPPRCRSERARMLLWLT